MPKKIVFIMFLLAAPILFSGCAAFLLATGAAAGAGTFAYVTGELRAVDEVELETAHKAAIEAVEELNFAVLYKEKDAIHSRIEASTAADTDVKIKMEKTSDSLTEIRIRVGIIGNKSLSQRILETMRENY